MGDLEIQEYIEKLEKIQNCLLIFIESENDFEENYQNVVNIFEDQKNILNNRQDFGIIHHILIGISNYHHRGPIFFEKIEKIFLILKDYYTKYFSNMELFELVSSNKRILLHFIKQKMITMNEAIYSRISKERKFTKEYYCYYLKKDIYSFLSIPLEYPEEEAEKVRNGENDTEICQIIRNDMIEEFIIFINKKNFPLNSFIEPSIYETNPFLLKKEDITLIEYAAFFGSLQIFKYLYMNGVELTDSVWLCAIHGDDSEMIHILEDELPHESYDECIKEAMKCHHNHIVNYFLNNLVDEKYNEIIVSYCFHYSNFSFYPKNIDTFYLLCYACKYNYNTIVKNILTNCNIDINRKVIQKKNIFYLWHFKIVLLNGVLILNFFI